MIIPQIVSALHAHAWASGRLDTIRGSDKAAKRYPNEEAAKFYIGIINYAAFRTASPTVTQSLEDSELLLWGTNGWLNGVGPT